MDFLPRLVTLLQLLLYALHFITTVTGFLALFWPVFVYRWLLARLHSHLHPDSAGMVSPLSSIYVSPDGSLKPAFNLVSIMKIEGHLELEDFVQLIAGKIVYSRGADGRLEHPELQQSIQLWGGYPFWTPNPEFEVRAQILGYEQLVEANPENWSRSSVKETRNEGWCSDFATRYVQQALNPGQSPWEMIVVRDVARESGSGFECDDTMVVLKFHHCLADGFAMFNTVMKCADCPVPRYEPPLPSKFEQVLAKVLYPFLAPVDMARARLEASSTPQTPWDKRDDPQAREYAKTRALSMSNLKQISAEYKIPFTAVLLGGLGHAIRSFMAQHQEKRIPPFILCGISLPTPSHPPGLTNDWYFTYIRVPLQGSSPLELMRYVADQFPAIRRSTLYVTRQHLHKLAHLLPTVWSWKTRTYDLFYGTGRRPWPTLLSSMPGPKDPVIVGGRRITEMSYIYNRAHGNPCLMTMLSYGDQFQVWFSVDEGVTFGQGVDALVECVNKQFESLELSSVNNPLETKL